MLNIYKNPNGKSKLQGKKLPATNIPQYQGPWSSLMCVKTTSSDYSISGEYEKKMYMNGK